MSAVLVVNSSHEATRLLPLAIELSHAAGRELQVIIAKEKSGDWTWKKVQADEEIMSLPNADRLTIRQLQSMELDRVIHVVTQGCRLLMIAMNEPVRDSRNQWAGRLLASVTCEAMCLRVPAEFPFPIERILVPVNGSDDSNAALRRSVSLCPTGARRITALHVLTQADAPDNESGKESGSESDNEQAQRRLRKLVKQNAGEHAEHVDQRIVTAEDVHTGVVQELAPAHSMLVIGTKNERTIRRYFFPESDAETFSETHAPVFVAVRAGVNTSTRIGHTFGGLVKRIVPQLERENRIALFERIAQASQWDFDFITLLSLSTAIAAFGLIQNQPAVVIGAMLVAPLMTPLIGAGLSVVQGNRELLRIAAGSVLRGFALAFAIGFAVGLMSDRFTDEMLARTSPGLLDMLVALCGGMAAAYATSRDNLSAALPGVAIAAALVPPIATAGITAAHGEYSFTLGALLLFGTNAVAIVLAVALTLWLVGLRDAHRHGGRQQWAGWMFSALMLLVMALGFLLSHKITPNDPLLLSQLNEQLSAAVVGSDVEAELVEYQRLDNDVLKIVIESPADRLGSLPERLLKVARQYSQTDSPTIKLEVRHVVRLSDDAEP